MGERSVRRRARAAGVGVVVLAFAFAACERDAASPRSVAMKPVPIEVAPEPTLVEPLPPVIVDAGFAPAAPAEEPSATELCGGRRVRRIRGRGASLCDPWAE